MGGRPNYGPTAQERTKRFLEALLAYANEELEGSERLQIEANWQTENKLVVRTKVRFLEELTAKYQQNSKLDTEQIKEALKRLKDWLEILEDNRTKTQGSEDWHFRLKLGVPASPRLSQLLCLNATAYQLALHPNFSQADKLVVGKVVTLGRLGFPGNSLYSIYLQTAVSS